jgi:hypothetical protein
MYGLKPVPSKPVPCNPYLATRTLQKKRDVRLKPVPFKTEAVCEFLRRLDIFLSKTDLYDSRFSGFF